MDINKIKEIVALIRSWCDKNGDEELNSYCESLEGILSDSGEADASATTSSNPPGSPPNPPGTGD